MKKICVINPNYYKSSGVTKVINKIYEGILQQYPAKYEFQFVDCLYGKEISSVSWIPERNYNVFKLMTTSPYLLLKESINFYRWAKKEKVDIIHIHHRRLALIISILNIFMRIKLIYTGHLTYRKSFLLKLFMTMPCVAISESVEKNLKETTSSKNITLIGNPVDFPQNQPRIDCIDYDTAVSIGRLSPVKGMKFIIDAYAILHKRGLKKKLIIVGEGDLKDLLMQQAIILGIEQYIHFVGFSDNVSEYIETSAFSILHSSVEGLGLVTIESAAIGRPSLVTNVDGSRDTVPPDTLLPNLVEYKNVKQLADHLEIWFDNPEKVKLDGKKFNAFLKERYSTEKVISGYHLKYFEIFNE